MPLNLDCTDPMYVLGRVIASLEDHGDKINGAVLDILLVTPAKGLPLVIKQFPDALVRESVGEMMDLLPAAGLPKGPVPIEDQGTYWMGYYHQRQQNKRDSAIVERFTPKRLRQVGETLYGPDHWQAEMTRDLALTDSSRVRAWISDNKDKRRRVPPGVCYDLMARLRRKSAEAKALADDIDAQPNDPPRS